MLPRLVRRTALPLWWAAALACGGTNTAAGPADAAGTYVLESVDGCAVGTPLEPCPTRRTWLVDGTMVLDPTGRAARVVRSQLPSDASPSTQASVGTFTLRGDVVELALREERDGAWDVWRVQGTLADGRLTLRYPHPADGYTVEVFRRE
jgi:hypothetical protein